MLRASTELRAREAATIQASHVRHKIEEQCLRKVEERRVLDKVGDKGVARMRRSPPCGRASSAC
eukprot:4519571-Pleurochrysis_carterae.AAC.1